MVQDQRSKNYTLHIHSTPRTRFQHRRQPHEAAQNDHRSKNAAQIAEHSHPKHHVRSEAGKNNNSVTVRSVQFLFWCGFEKKFFYLMRRRTRLFSMSYTPSRRDSFLRRRTGPSSGSTHGHPLVVGSGSVAARRMAPATRSTGVVGMPAVMSFVCQSMMLVAAQ